MLRHLYPLFLDVSQRLIVIIGGGAVAARKANGVLEAGATRLRIVAPRFTATMPVAGERITESYHPRHLEGAGLVFAATDSPDVNQEVVCDCRARGVLVCRADSDEEEPGDFLTPAKFRLGNVIVSVSAGGNPALGVLIRDGLRQRFDPAWERLAGAMEALRPRVLSSIASIDERRMVFRELASAEAIEVLEREGTDGLTEWVRRRHADLL